MVKINLLAEGKRPVVTRKAKAPLLGGAAQELGNILLVAGLVVGLLGAAGWIWVVNGKLKQKQAEVVKAQREVEELQQVIKEVDDYKTKKTELERKIDVINGLKANQRGPVQIMDQVSRALPELLWLTHMDVTATTISMRGTAFNMSAVANFIDNLDKVEEFAEPILNDATQRPIRGSRGELYDFKITMSYSFQKPKAPTLTTQASEGGIAPATPGGAPAQSGGGE